MIKYSNCFIPLSTASIDQADTGHVITGPVITGPVGTGSTRSRQAKQRSVLKEAFKNAWKQGNISSQVSKMKIPTVCTHYAHTHIFYWCIY